MRTSPYRIQLPPGADRILRLDRCDNPAFREGFVGECRLRPIDKMDIASLSSLKEMTSQMDGDPLVDENPLEDGVSIPNLDRYPLLKKDDLRGIHVEFHSDGTLFQLDHQNGQSDFAFLKEGENFTQVNHYTPPDSPGEKPQVKILKRFKDLQGKMRHGTITANHRLEGGC